jgi:hypothetical protein
MKRYGKEPPGRKRATKSSARKPGIWHEYFSLGTGLLFLSFLALAGKSFAGGTFIFLVGVYFLIRGSHLKGKRAPFSEWMNLKVLQALVLAGLGVILMISLPPSFFGSSFLITLTGFLMFLSLKLRYSAASGRRLKTKPLKKMRPPGK